MQNRSDYIRLITVGVLLLSAMLACNFGRETLENSPEAHTAEARDNTAIALSGNLTATSSMATQSAEVEASSIELTKRAGASTGGGVAPVPIVIPTKPAGARSATLVFDFAQMRLADASLKFTQLGCQPPSPNGYFYLLLNGTLTGRCSRAEGVVSAEGSLSGTYDAKSGQVTFHLETTQVRRAEINTDSVTIIGIFDGSTNLAGGNTVLGTATVSYTCKGNGKGVGVLCPGRDPMAYQTSGSVPFTMQFNP
jgi:hypothetical protein